MAGAYGLGAVAYAATLHAMHYHKVNVINRQEELKSRGRANLDDILTLPVADRPSWSPEDIQAGSTTTPRAFWAMWSGGSNKDRLFEVPDINNVGLMEDRATLRISSQHRQLVAWRLHGGTGP